MIEKDLAELIKLRPEVIEEGLTFEGEEITTPVGRLDSLWKDKNGIYVVMEYKWPKAEDRTVGQLARYMGWIKQEYQVSQVRGIILCQQATEKLKVAATISPDLTINEIGIPKEPEQIMLEELKKPQKPFSREEAAMLFGTLGHMYAINIPPVVELFDISKLAPFSWKELTSVLLFELTWVLEDWDTQGINDHLDAILEVTTLFMRKRVEKGEKLDSSNILKLRAAIQNINAMLDHCFGPVEQSEEEWVEERLRKVLQEEIGDLIPLKSIYQKRNIGDNEKTDEQLEIQDRVKTVEQRLDSIAEKLIGSKAFEYFKQKEEGGT